MLVTSVPRARFNRDGSKTVNCGLQAYHDAMVKVGEETGTDLEGVPGLPGAPQDEAGLTRIGWS